MTHFDFSSYHRPPQGFKVLRADDELWLWRSIDSRYYRVWCPEPGEFLLCFSSNVPMARADGLGRVPAGRPDPGMIVGWEFILRSDSLFRILRALGALRVDSPKYEQLEIPGTNVRAFKKRT